MYRYDYYDDMDVFVIVFLAFLAFMVVIVLAVSARPSAREGLPTPVEACGKHGGVSSFNDGWAVCKDGVAREAG